LSASPLRRGCRALPSTSLQHHGRTPPEAKAHRSLPFRRQPQLTPLDLARRPLDLAKRRGGPGATNTICLHNNCARPTTRHRSKGPWPQHCRALPWPPAVPQGRRPRAPVRPLAHTSPSPRDVDPHVEPHPVPLLRPGSMWPIHAASICTCLVTSKHRTTSTLCHGRHLTSLCGRRSPHGHCMKPQERVATDTPNSGLAAAILASGTAFMPAASFGSGEGDGR
jgi:hypothetical protein